MGKLGIKIFVFNTVMTNVRRQVEHRLLIIVKTQYAHKFNKKNNLL